MTTFNHQALSPEVRHRARALRQTQSKSESFLWELLRNRRLNGVKFRRQYPFPPYTLDFYALEQRVAIELDGELHERTKDEDELRDRNLIRSGILTVRLTTAELFGNPKAALEKIWSVVSNR